MTELNPIVVAGIDVGKSKLDAHILDSSLERQFDNTKPGRRAPCATGCSSTASPRAVFEPTGRYHRNLHQGLAEAGLETVLVNPLRSPPLRRSHRKTRQERPRRCRHARPASASSTTSRRPHPSRATSSTSATGSPSRRKLVEQLGALRKLCAELAPEAAGCPGATLDALQTDSADCERRMLTCIAADTALSRRAAIIRSIPGCGPVTAACLCADMPDLGTLGRRQAASLFGLAPFDRDSGQHRGGRSIRGGRAQPRHLLYMAALSTVRCEPTAKAFYERLLARGKPAQGRPRRRHAQARRPARHPAPRGSSLAARASHPRTAGRRMSTPTSGSQPNLAIRKERQENRLSGTSLPGYVLDNKHGS